MRGQRATLQQRTHVVLPGTRTNPCGPGAALTLHVRHLLRLLVVLLLLLLCRRVCALWQWPARGLRVLPAVVGAVHQHVGHGVHRLHQLAAHGVAFTGRHDAARGRPLLCGRRGAGQGTTHEQCAHVVTPTHPTVTRRVPPRLRTCSSLPVAHTTSMSVSLSPSLSLSLPDLACYVAPALTVCSSGASTSTASTGFDHLAGGMPTRRHNQIRLSDDAPTRGGHL